MKPRRTRLCLLLLVVLTSVLPASFVPAGGLAVCVSAHGHVEIKSALATGQTSDSACPCASNRVAHECPETHCDLGSHGTCRDLLLKALPDTTAVKAVGTSGALLPRTVHEPLPTGGGLLSKHLEVPERPQRWSARPSDKVVAGSFPSVFLRSVVLLI